MTAGAWKERPNIILVNCDDLGYGDLGCYGSTVNDTPALDRLAADGMRFTDFYMASPACTPSRGAMMTGCYPPRIGFDLDGTRMCVLFPGSPHGLHPEERTIASLLKDQGYATKLVGKWHCGDQAPFLPTEHGFDEYYGIPYSNDMGRQGGAEQPPLPLMRNDAVIQCQPDMVGLTERYVEESVRFLREHRDGPFFLYLAHMYVHLPIYVQEHFARASRNGRYGAAVACIDWAMAVLMRELQDLGIDEHTLVIFTSDNGSRARGEGGSNGPLRGHKGQTWDGGQRVPCIARWPGRIPAGSTCEALSSAMDFYPTLAALAGASVPTDRVIDGKDISALLSGEDNESPHAYFFYYFQLRLEAVRDARWKLHVAKDGEPMLALYDMRVDGAEEHDCAAQHPEIVERLKGALATCRQELGDSLTGVTGSGCRPIGRVENATPLTTYDPTHPYVIAMYDLKEWG